MKLLFFRTAWGVEGSWIAAASEAQAFGFDGWESPCPPSRHAELAHIRQELAMPWICEISTTGFAVPDPRASPRDHLEALARAIEAAMEFRPVLFTCMAGNDLWDEDTTIRFLREVVRLGRGSGKPLAVETHRSRALFHPRITRRLLEAVPELEVTCDFSHWCVVCERLVLDEQPELLELCAQRVRHIHARVGWDQGAQVDSLEAPRHQHALAAHLKWWRRLLEGMAARGFSQASLTPEFGPDGYQMLHPDTAEPVGSLFGMANAIRRKIVEAWDKR